MTKSAEDIIVNSYGAFGYGVMHKAREVVLSNPSTPEEVIEIVARDLYSDRDEVALVVYDMIYNELAHEKGGLIYELGFKRKRYKKKFIPPSPEEIESYARSKGHKVDGKQIYEYYQEADWKDRNNKPIKNWKLKVFSVWCKEENKTSDPRKNFDEILNE